LSSRRWPPPKSLIADAQNIIGSNARVRVEVEEDEFGRPWSNTLAGTWTNENLRNVSGQICLTDSPSIARPTSSRHLSYRGLAHSKDDGIHGSLPMARGEVTALAERFRKWGAEVEMYENNATKQDFGEALKQAEIVHVAAHASYDRILMADGPYTVAELSKLDLSSSKCRLLLLSACEAGEMEEKTALLWELVLAGINVIAARRPVHDHICRIFFGEFVNALLPTRQAVGIEVADAIRSAVINSRKRLAKISGGVDDEVMVTFTHTVDSFVLFGDPTLRLEMGRPG
jgi:hypothetical protein